MSEEQRICPGIVVPNKIFLVGFIYGLNVARERLEDNVQPLFSDMEENEMKPASNQDFYLGSWLEVTCGKCGMLYTFDGPNDLPFESLNCSNKDCDNILIYYGVLDPMLWRVGEFKIIK